jgi:hypothetical protein
MSEEYQMFYSYDPDTHEVTPIIGEDAVNQWATEFERTKRRRLFLAEIPPNIRVSTVFLGLNHQYEEGPPLVFETMVFGGAHDQAWEERYSTYDEAKAGHEAMIERVLESLKPKQLEE